MFLSIYLFCASIRIRKCFRRPSRCCRTVKLKLTSFACRSVRPCRPTSRAMTHRVSVWLIVPLHFQLICSLLWHYCLNEVMKPISHLPEIQLCIKHIVKSIQVHVMQNKTFQACSIVSLYTWLLLKKQGKNVFLYTPNVHLWIHWLCNVKPLSLFWNGSHHHKSDLEAKGVGVTRTAVSMKGATCVASLVSLLNKNPSQKRLSPAPRSKKNWTVILHGLVD